MVNKIFIIKGYDQDYWATLSMTPKQIDYIYNEGIGYVEEIELYDDADEVINRYKTLLDELQ